MIDRRFLPVRLYNIYYHIYLCYIIHIETERKLVINSFETNGSLYYQWELKLINRTGHSMILCRTFNTYKEAFNYAKKAVLL